MTKYNPYRITTDGAKYRIEQLVFCSAKPNDDTQIWSAISQEMDHLAQAKVALDRLNNPRVWTPISQ